MTVRRGIWLAVWLLGVFAWTPLHAQTIASPVTTIDHAEAAPAGWTSVVPPVKGWTPVTLMNTWTRQWPHHDGVVWYRLRWNQANSKAPVGLLVNYADMADEIWVNGSLVYRDPSLVEPLSRRWVEPQFFVIDKPLLRAGENSLLIRVSGLAAYQPGLGIVKVGPAKRVQAEYRTAHFWRYGIHAFNVALSVMLGVLFGLFWLLRRKETVFGWYALSTLFGAGYGWNFIASSPWPFGNTDAWEAMNAALFAAMSVTLVIFLLRFCGKRWRRTETVLLLAGAASLLAALLLPHVTGPWRNVLVVPALALVYVSIVVFFVYALRVRRADMLVMGGSLLADALAAVIDVLTYLGVIQGSNYDLRALVLPVVLVGMGFAIAWRFAAAMRRVEGFNIELNQKVDAATTQLAHTMARGHALALSHARISERLGMVRDLHDGFGGSLLGTIGSLEQLPPTPATTRAVKALHQLRDDLRLVIDTTTHEHDTDLAGLLAPLRHRWSQRLEVVAIDSRWQLEGLDGLRLGAARSLDLLRLLQEALTNVLKHSQAHHVDVAVRRVEDALDVAICDDGCGLDRDQVSRHAEGGAGLASMRQRAERLGGELDVDSSAGRGTTLRTTVGLDLSSTS